MLDNKTLFSKIDGVEPDWSKYRGLEIQANYEDGGEVIPASIWSDADFMTIYGRHHVNETGIVTADAITDVWNPQICMAVLSELLRRSGLPMEGSLK